MSETTSAAPRLAPIRPPEIGTTEVIARRITWVVFAVSTVWRAVGLSRSLWWDEVYTAWAYVLRGPDTIRLASAYIPNNHTLFSWLTWATSEPFGLGEPVLRAWSFLPGTIASVLLLLFAARWFGWVTAAILSVCFALSPLHALLVTEARGYGLILLATTLLLLGTTQRINGDAVRGEVLLVAGTLIGALTIPTVAIPAAVFWLLAILMGPRPTARTVGLVAAIGGIGAWWYRPILSEITSRTTAVGSRHGDPPGLLDPLVGPVRLLGIDAIQGLELILPQAMVVLLLTLVILLGFVVAYRSTRAIGLQILLVPAGTIIAYAVLGMHLVPRYIGMLLPLTFLAIAVGLSVIGVWLIRWSSTGGVALVVLMSTATIFLTLPATIAANEPRQAFAEVADVAAELQPSTVVMGGNDIGYRYYLRDFDLQLLEDEPEVLCAASEPALFLEAATGPGPGPTELACLSSRGFQPLQFPQSAHPGFLTVWVLTSEAAR